MPTPLHPEYFWYAPYRQAFGAGRLQTSGDAWASYVGFVDAPIIVKHAEILLTVLAVGTQTAEMGLFSSPAAPGANQTLTKIVASGDINLTSMIVGTAPFMVRNTSSWAQAIPAGTHLWIITRFAFTVTQPTIAEGVSYTRNGDVLYLTGASALTGLSTIAMTIPTQAVLAQGPPYPTACEI